MVPAPKVDPRLARDVVHQIRELLPIYVERWPQGPSSGAGEAVIGVFARYCEIIIDRLNKVPGKNLLAFLDLLGVSLAPPQPARVPLTFYLAAQSPTEAVVPALTQVAALPAKGEKEPVVFETELELILTPALLDSLWVSDAARDRYADYEDLLDQTALPPPAQKTGDAEFFKRVVLNLTGQPATSDQVAAFATDSAADKRSRLLDKVLAGGVPMFQGNRPFEHILYVGLPSKSSALLWRELRLRIVLERDLSSLPGALQWETWNGQAGVPITPASDSTQNLTRSGEVFFTNVLAPPLVTAGTRARRWLRLSWTAPETGVPVATALPVIADLAVAVVISQNGLPVELAFFNTLPLDLSKDFFPFGERPKFGDTLYISSPIFSDAGATVTLKVQMTNPAAGEGPPPPVPPVKANAPVLKWEFWDGQGWQELGRSDMTAAAVPRLRLIPKETPSGTPGDTGFSDTTQAFTRSGQISFRFPSAPQPVVLNGQNKYWIRVRLASGDYGREARYEHDAMKGFVLTPATFAPPLIHSVQIDQSLTITAPPEEIFTYNDFSYRYITRPIQPFSPFETSRELQSCCYLGFQSGGRTFPSRSMSLYFGVESSGDAADEDRPPIVWEYWNGNDWTLWTVRDNTRGLRSSGIIRFLAPPDFSATSKFGRNQYWLRARKIQESTFQPMLQRVLLNTTMASQTRTTLGEVLGSGSGKPGQVFRTARSPILEGQSLEVLELSVPPSGERDTIEREEGVDAITEVPGTTPERPTQAWVRWHEVSNFEGSGPRDRHYAIDRPVGEIRFGDAVKGMAPPTLTGNIRMTRYQTGGGSGGNKPAASIVQMKTTVPYVERATNFEAADGGADAELPEDVLERDTRRIRHQGRAVTAQDFEDLALLASNEVARALCIPMRDLHADRMAKEPRPGVISLVVVPRCADGAMVPAPPRTELFARVRTYLDEHRFTGAKLVLSGPEYLRIHVKAEITVADVDTASDVELSVTRALPRYLNPLAGFKGAGWDFGRVPNKSDLYALIEALPGVEHVRSLEMRMVGDLPDTVQTGRFLVAAGDVQVTTTLEK